MRLAPAGLEESGGEVSGQFKVHFHLDDGLHQMDALVRNRAEGEALALLREVSRVLSTNFRIETRAYGEGGLEEYLVFLGQNKEQIGIIISILGALLSAPFYRQKLKQSKQQTALNELNLVKLKLEIKEKESAQAASSSPVGNESKSSTGTLNLEPPPTVDDFAYALLLVKKIARRRSNLYQALLDEHRVKAIGFAAGHSQLAPERIVQRAQFQDFILDQTESDPDVYVQVPIEVVSPVLRAQALKWRGLFNRKVISFELTDQEFRRQVDAQRVQFQHGTTLICDLEIHLREDETGEPEVVGYVVPKVHEVKTALQERAQDQLTLQLRDLPPSEPT